MDRGRGFRTRPAWRTRLKITMELRIKRDSTVLVPEKRKTQPRGVKRTFQPKTKCSATKICLVLWEWSYSPSDDRKKGMLGRHRANIWCWSGTHFLHWSKVLGSLHITIALQEEGQGETKKKNKGKKKESDRESVYNKQTSKQRER